MMTLMLHKTNRDGSSSMSRLNFQAIDKLTEAFFQSLFDEIHSLPVLVSRDVGLAARTSSDDALPITNQRDQDGPKE